MEKFVAKWILEDIADKTDHKQFGVIKGTSFSLCLAKIGIMNWKMTAENWNHSITFKYHLHFCVFLHFCDFFTLYILFHFCANFERN